MTSGSREAGPDMFTATAYGNSMDELKLAALDLARGFYGAEAPLQIEGVGPVEATNPLGVARGRGRYNAPVRIRCLRLPEGW